jgi:hypothetical protein
VHASRPCKIQCPSESQLCREELVKRLLSSVDIASALCGWLAAAIEESAHDTTLESIREGCNNDSRALDFSPFREWVIPLARETRIATSACHHLERQFVGPGGFRMKASNVEEVLQGRNGACCMLLAFSFRAAAQLQDDFLKTLNEMSHYRPLMLRCCILTLRTVG